MATLRDAFVLTAAAASEDGEAELDDAGLKGGPMMSAGVARKGSLVTPLRVSFATSVTNHQAKGSVRVFGVIQCTKLAVGN